MPTYLAVDQLQKEVERLKAKIQDLQHLVNQKEAERDEARFIAQRLLQEGQFHLATIGEYEDAHPWLAHLGLNL